MSSLPTFRTMCASIGWWHVFLLAGDAIVNLFLALLNPFDRLGEDYPSFNVLSGTLKTGVICIVFPVPLGPFYCTSVSTKVTLSLGWAWGLTAAVTAHHVHVQLDLPDAGAPTAPAPHPDPHPDTRPAPHPAPEEQGSKKAPALSSWTSSFARLALTLRDVRVCVGDELEVRLQDCSLSALRNAADSCADASIRGLSIRSQGEFGDERAALFSLSHVRLEGHAPLGGISPAAGAGDSKFTVHIAAEDCAINICPSYCGALASLLDGIVQTAAVNSPRTDLDHLVRRLRAIDSERSQAHQTLLSTMQDVFSDTYECSPYAGRSYFNSEIHVVASAVLARVSVILPHLDAEAHSQVLSLAGCTIQLRQNSEGSVDAKSAESVALSVYSVETAVRSLQVGARVPRKDLADGAYVALLQDARTAESDAPTSEEVFKFQYEVFARPLPVEEAGRTEFYAYEAVIEATLQPISVPLDVLALSSAMAAFDEVGAVVRFIQKRQTCKSFADPLRRARQAAAVVGRISIQAPHVRGCFILGGQHENIGFSIVNSSISSSPGDSALGIGASAPNSAGRISVSVGSVAFSAAGRGHSASPDSDGQSFFLAEGIRLTRADRRSSPPVPPVLSALLRFDASAAWYASSQELAMLKAAEEGSWTSDATVSAVTVCVGGKEVEALGFLRGALTPGGAPAGPEWRPAPIAIWCMPECCTSTRVCIESLSTALEWRDADQRVVRYTCADNNSITYSAAAAGDLCAESTLVVGGDIAVRMTSSQGSERLRDLDLLRIVDASASANAPAERRSHGAEPLRSVRCLSAHKMLPSEIHWCGGTKRGESFAVGVMAGYTTFNMMNIVLSLDFKDIEQLCECVKAYSLAQQQGRRLASARPPIGLVLADTYHITAPTSIVALHLDSLKLDMQHKQQPVLCLLVQSVEVHVLKFGPALTQYAALAHSPQLFEKTTQYAVHTCLISDIEEAGRLELHATKRAGECSLVEVRVEQVRFVYLQRCTMTLLSFLRDHFFPAAHAAMAVGTGPGAQVAAEPPRGMLRLGIAVTQSEVHLPMSSCGTDALVIIVDKLNLYRSCATMTPNGAQYCQGPYIARRRWLSQLKQSRRLLYLLFDSEAGAAVNTALPERWEVAQKAVCYNDLSAPRQMTVRGATDFALAFSLEHSVICSWCNANAVGTDVNIYGRFKLSPVSREPGAPVMNTMSIDVCADELDWTLAQGQYLAIINLIQQNFCELVEVVEDVYQYSPPKTVELTDSLFRSNVLQAELPTLSTVPVHIAKGRIITTDNALSYYDLFCKPLPPPYFPYGRDGHNFSTRFEDTIPAHSHHHKHRRKLFEPAGRGASEASHADAEPIDPETSSGLKDGNETEHGDVVIGVLFEGLEIDFYNKHKTGGNGIEISAMKFLIVSVEEPADDDGLSTTSINLDEISIESIIFAPRSFAPLNSGDKSRPARRKSRSEGDREKVSAFETAEGGGEARPHIRYSQQGNGNLRRCVVTITDSAAVANVAKALHAVEYFLKPIHNNAHRNQVCIEHAGLGPWDFKAALDAEVHVHNTVVCLTNITEQYGAHALCFQVDLDYAQAWRGFLFSGPGLISLNIDISVGGIYIAPMCEINSAQIQSMVEPCVLVVGQEVLTLPRENVLERNLGLLLPWVRLGTWAGRPNRHPYPQKVRTVKFKVAPVSKSPVEGTQPSRSSEALFVRRGSVDSADVRQGDSTPGSPNIPADEESSAGLARVQMSLQDLFFIVEAVKQAKSSLTRRLLVTSTEQDLYAPAKAMRQDVSHLPLLTHYLVHTPLAAEKRLKNNELIAQICDFEAILRNNTYNLNILRLDVFDNCMMFSRSVDQMHMAAGTACAVWSFNELQETWEPIVEPITLRAIGATDESNQLRPNDKGSGVFTETGPTVEPGMQPETGPEAGVGAGPGAATGAKVRVEVVTDPLELNAAETALASMLSKLSLNDVVTTSSTQLPPYKIINELGVEIVCSISINENVISENNIAVGQFLPIEVQQLWEALETHRAKRNMRGAPMGGSSSFANEYLMRIKFPNFRDQYESKAALSIDKVGTHAFEMASTGAHSPVRGSIVDLSRILGSSSRSAGALDVLAAVGEVDAEQDDLRDSYSNSQDVQELSHPHRNSAPEGDAAELAGADALELAASSVAKSSAGASDAAAVSVDSASEDATPATPPPKIAQSLSARPIKFVQEVPLAVLEMKIKADGVRELLLRSILSFTNNTGRLVHMSVRLYGSSAETALGPDKTWYVPVRFVNPRSSLYLRLGDAASWVEALPAMQSLIAQGYWGDPARLRAQLCACPLEGANTATSSGWMVLLKPEVVDVKAQMHDGNRSFVPVRYPAQGATPFKPKAEGAPGADANPSAGAVLKTRSARVQPMCVQLLAPLQLCNLFPQPLLYRVADSEGLITSEGIILPGEIFDVHSLQSLFSNRIFISVRMLNYSWSKWAVLFSRSAPFSTTERAVDLVLPSMHFNYRHRDLTLPSVVVSMVMRENIVRLSCAVLICNRSGVELDFCEASSSDSFFPQASRPAAHTLLPVLGSPTPRGEPAQRQSGRGYKVRSLEVDADGLDDEVGSDGRSSSTEESGEEDEEQDSFAVQPNGTADADADTVSSQGDAGMQPPIVLTPTRIIAKRFSSTSPLSSASTPFNTPLLIRGGAASSESTPPSAMRGPRGGRIVVVSVHLPHDHLRHVDIVASAEWTLLDVFSRLRQHLSSCAACQAEGDYLFVPWENGKLGSRRIDNALIIEAEDSAAGVAEGEIKKEVEEGPAEPQAGDSAPTASPSSPSSKASPAKPVLTRRNSTAVDTEVPELMKIGLLADCPDAPIPKGSKVGSLSCLRLRLCHVAERDIFEQTKGIKAEVAEKRGLFSSLLSRARCTFYAPFMRAKGDLPFRPQRMMGFNPSLSLRVPGETDWSDGVDVVKADFDASDLSISACGASAKLPSGSSTYYEFGAYVERGTGFLQNTTTVTIVPKHVMVSKLSMAIEVEQIFPSAAATPFTLQPGALYSYHFPSKSKSQLLHIRRVSKSKGSGADVRIAEEEWQAEVDICKLGVVYAKLRDPLIIVRVSIESVGASLVATLTEQSTLWPPYRIDNMTDMEIRFRQIVNRPSQDSAGRGKGQSGRALSERVALPTVDELLPSSEAEAAPSAVEVPPTDVQPDGRAPAPSPNRAEAAMPPWDSIERRGFSPFAWDKPFSGQKKVQLEIKQLSTWVRCEVQLDDDARLPPVLVKKKAPSLGNPIAEGYLLRQDPDTDAWVPVYCILRPDVLYVYPDDSREILLGVVNMSRAVCAAKGRAADAHFASVMRYQDKRWLTSMDYFNPFPTAAPSSQSRSKPGMDYNRTRWMILQIADHLGVFAQYSTDRLASSSPSFSEAEGDLSPEASVTAPEPPFITHDTDSSGAAVVPGEEPLEAEDWQVGGDADDDFDFDGDVPGADSRGRLSSVAGPTLDTLLKGGCSVDELLEECANAPVRLADIVAALLATKQVSKAERAREICEWMLSEKLLVPRALSKAIDGKPAESGSDSDTDSDGDAAPTALPDSHLDSADCPDSSPVEIPPSRMSMTSLSRAISSRAPFSGAGRPLSENLEKQSSRSSMVSLRRPVKRGLFRLFEDVDLVLNPPSLNEELLAMLDKPVGASRNAQADEQKAEDGTGTGTGTGANGAPEREIFGFSILMESVKHSFKCSSEMEFVGWVQACRQAIERCWTDHVLGRSLGRVSVSLDDFQTAVLFRLRADGSTRVLEILQDQDNIASGEQSGGLQRSSRRRNSVSSAEAISKLSKVLRSSSSRHDSTFGDFSPDQDFISVLFAIQSVGLSVVNAEPMEVFHLVLQGIEMTVERSLDLVKFAVTVQEILVSNQLLKPDFPVALFPRRMREAVHGSLMLPGLDPNRTSYPSLHLYIQQRYHQSIGDVESTGTENFDEDSNLHYFEVFTLWISPLQLDIDEEIIVKCIRYVRSLRDVAHNPSMGRASANSQDAIAFRQLGSSCWEGRVDKEAVLRLFQDFMVSGIAPYVQYSSSAKSSTGIYLSLLQLHPIDLVMTFRPSTQLVVTSSESAIISVISQLDGARLCLNALIAEHAFGSPAILGEILAKHYKSAFWRQFHRLIGSSDIVEGSVGLVANLGTGVYDLFYEPIDGLLDKDGSFLNGLSKGGISLASRTIGGTSAFTSKITGGLGKGVSLLTLDSQFQRNRSYRRFNKASTVSEGLYVGTQELGKNIVEGVAGIVVSPYRGWESGGGVGLGMGIAKGLLGVALKPAVGVFDLASRATEGLRNTAFSQELDLPGDRFGVNRKRIPRAFGRNGLLTAYNLQAAAAQYVADSVTCFQREPRLHVVHHLHVRRKIVKREVAAPPPVEAPAPEADTQSAAGESKPADDEGIVISSDEAWGYARNHSYLILVSPDRVVLSELLLPERKGAKRETWRKSGGNQKFIWSCPAQYIEQLYTHPCGDLILSISTSVLTAGTWNSNSPVALDNTAQNYVIFQSLLEQTIGIERARTQPLYPTSGILQANIRKKYSSGIKSFFSSPSNHTYRLCGNVLYEYSDSKSRAGAKAEAVPGAAEEASPAEQEQVSASIDRSDECINKVIREIFPCPADASSSSEFDPRSAEVFTSFAYPLVDLFVVGPVPEDNGKSFSILISRLDGQKMRVLKREEEGEHFSEYLKVSLSLIFATHEDARSWRRYIEKHTIFSPDDALPQSPLTVEEKVKRDRSLIKMGGNRGSEDATQPCDDSILGMLVLPTSGCKADQTEDIKIEIAKTLSATRWR